MSQQEHRVWVEDLTWEMTARCEAADCRFARKVSGYTPVQNHVMRTGHMVLVELRSSERFVKGSVDQPPNRRTR